MPLYEDRRAAAPAGREGNCSAFLPVKKHKRELRETSAFSFSSSEILIHIYQLCLHLFIYYIFFVILSVSPDSFIKPNTDCEGRYLCYVTINVVNKNIFV